ncbi:MAG: helix-turn-helix domain-containing protein [Spirosomataceae bacterium]
MLLYAAILLFILALLIIIRSFLDGSKEYLLGLLCIIFSLYMISYQVLFLHLSVFFGAILFNHFAPVYFLIGPILLWYSQYVIGDNRPFKRADFLHFLPAIIHFLGIFSYFFIPFEEKKELVEKIYSLDGYILQVKVNDLFSMGFLHLARLISYIGYVGYTTYYIVQNRNKLSKYIYNWLLFTIVLIVIQIGVFAFFAFLLFHDNVLLGVTERTFATSIGLIEITLGLICLFIYPYEHIIQRKRNFTGLEEVTITQKNTVHQESTISYDSLLKEKIRTYFEQQKPYLNPEFNALDVTVALNVPQHQISACLKNEFEMTFTEYRTKARVEHAIRLLHSDEAKRVTMEAIGQKSGFHSKSVFFKSFKEVTGVSPSVFLKENVKE